MKPHGQICARLSSLCHNIIIAEVVMLKRTSKSVDECHLFLAIQSFSVFFIFSFGFLLRCCAHPFLVYNPFYVTGIYLAAVSFAVTLLVLVIIPNITTCCMDGALHVGRVQVKRPY